MRSDSHLLEDITTAIAKIADFTSGMQMRDFIADEKTRAAVERQFTIMGEAANRLSAAFKAEHPDIPWSRLVQLRNFYTHAYERLTPEEVWGTAIRLAPRIGRQVHALMNNESDDT